MEDFFIPDRDLTIGDDFYNPDDEAVDFNNIQINNKTESLKASTTIHYYNQKHDEDGNYYFKSSSDGETTIEALIEGIKNPKPSVKDLIDRIRIETNKTKQSELKSKLTGFIIQSFGTGLKRDYKNIVSFTGYTVLDFDGQKVKEYSKQLKQFLFDSYDFIVASYISPSGAVKCIMRVEIAQSVEEYQEYYRAIEGYFKQYAGFDATPKNAVLIMFFTYDPNILVRTDATVWATKLTAPVKSFTPAPSSTILKDISLNTKRAYGLTNGLFNKIVDNGHPQLRSLSKLLGGYISQYNLNLTDAEEWLCNKIESHSYLCKGIAGYIKTSKRFLQEGLNEPISFPK